MAARNRPDFSTAFWFKNLTDDLFAWRLMEDRETATQLHGLLRRYGDYSDELLNRKDPEYSMSTPIVRGDWFGDFCYQSKQTNYMYPHHQEVKSSLKELTKMNVYV